MKKAELLSPAGSFESLECAVFAGADAVYLAGQMFGARAYAGNFTDEELLKAIDYAHIRNVSVYLTINTLLKEKELETMLFSYLKPLYLNGLDGVIVQDAGVISYVREAFPLLPVHASTQMNITGIDGVKYLEKLGVRRVILARELSLSEIRRITEATAVEIECFVHGAMCYCYSGQCLMSSMLGSRSGNRGRCAQPCRLPYSFDEGKTGYYLSMKDMNTLAILPEMIESGIASFKIEGRMKQPSYVRQITALYRKYIDKYYTEFENGKTNTEISKEWHIDADDMKIAAKDYGRCGSGTGYYGKRNGRDMITVDSPSYTASDHLSQASKRRCDDKRMPVEGTVALKKAEKASLSICCDSIIANASGEVVTEAKNQPISEDDLRSRISKTGNTPFYFKELSVILEDNCYCTVSGINALRRTAIDQLSERILSRRRRNEAEIVKDAAGSIEREVTPYFGMTAAVLTEEHLEEVLKSSAKGVYLEPELWISLDDMAEENISRCRRAGKQCFLAFPYIMRRTNTGKSEEAFYLKKLNKADGALVRTYEEIEMLKRIGYKGFIISDACMYTWNERSRSALAAAGISRDTVPLELKRSEIYSRGAAGSEMIIYGRMPLMVSAQCSVKTDSGKCRPSAFHYLTDRIKIRFPVRNCCRFCYNIVYNSVALCLFEEKEELRRDGIVSFRLSFTVENKNETRQILKLYEDPAHSDKTGFSFTRGHYRKGIE